MVACPDMEALESFSSTQLEASADPRCPLPQGRCG